MEKGTTVPDIVIRVPSLTERYDDMLILASFWVEATLPLLHMYKTATLQVYTTDYYLTTCTVLRWCRDMAYHCARPSE